MWQPEPGLDGWHVCGLDGALFYSEDPVIKVSESRDVNIKNAGRHHWTKAMHKRHAQVCPSTGVFNFENQEIDAADPDSLTPASCYTTSQLLEFGCANYAHMLGRARSALVSHTCPMNEDFRGRAKIPERYHISVPDNIKEFSLFEKECTGKSLETLAGQPLTGQAMLDLVPFA